MRKNTTVTDNLTAAHERLQAARKNRIKLAREYGKASDEEKAAEREYESARQAALGAFPDVRDV